MIGKMSKKNFDHLQSIEGISALNINQFDLSMINSQNPSSNQYTIKINAPSGQFNQVFEMSEKAADIQNKKISTKNVFNMENTGYDINRQLFSDDDIREAFNTIDINNDGSITVEELSFFLKCMNQPHTVEEVEEMIRMVSNDGRKVVLEEFKKIGRGKLPPFAAIKQPQVEAMSKEEVLENIRESISQSDPNNILELSQELQISRQKFEEQKIRKQDYHQLIFEPLDDQNGGMRNRTSQEISKKKEDYSRVLMFNVDKALQALKSIKHEVIELTELAEVLSISDQEAKMLFQKQRLTVRSVLLDVILFSQCSNIRKLELILNNKGHSKTLDLEEWINVLCFMMGVNSRKFIRGRLQNILRQGKVSTEAKYDRYFILKLMTQEEQSFQW